jgi:dTDP-4-amino-4,6-dideoxygalactose transaminase
MPESSIPYARHSVDDADRTAVAEVLEGEWLTTGPAVREFEDALSEVAGGVPCVAVSSGTAALHSAYAACGLGPGDEVITTPLTFAATATAALHLGAGVRFADIDGLTLNIDPQAVARACSERTKVIVAVDFAGQPARLDELRRVADDVGAVLIEDAAHSLGASFQHRPVGAVADLTTFSFHPVKAITTGEGGAIAVGRPDLLESVRRFRDHGLVRERDRQQLSNEGAWHQEVQQLGLNYRMPDILAALGRSQLGKLEKFVERRAGLVRRYRDALGEVAGLTLVEEAPDVRPAWHLFVVRIQQGRRREVYDHLRASGIGVQVHYLPVYWHPIFEAAGYGRGLCPVAEAAYEEILSLPLFVGLTESMQDRVIGSLLEALEVGEPSSSRRS